MQVTLRPITDIRPYENNPRLNDDAVAAVAAVVIRPWLGEAID